MHLPAFCCVKTGLEDTRLGRVSGRQHALWLLVGLAQTKRDLIARSLGHDVHLPALYCVKTGLEDTRPGIASGDRIYGGYNQHMKDISDVSAS